MTTQYALAGLALVALYLWSIGRISLPAARPAPVAPPPAPAPIVTYATATLVTPEPAREDRLHTLALEYDRLSKERELSEALAAAKVAKAAKVLAPPAPPTPDPPKG